MKFEDEIARDLSVAKKIWLPWWGVLGVIVGTVFVCFLADNFGNLDVVSPALNTIAVFAFVIAVKRALRNRLWFWLTLIILAVLHVLVIAIVPWSGKGLPPIPIAFFDSVDFCALLIVLAWVQSLLGRNAGPGDRNAK